MAVEKNRASAAQREALSQIIKTHEAKVSGHLNGLMRQTVRGTLNQMLDAGAQEDATNGQAKATAVVEKLRVMKLKKAAQKVAESESETPPYYRLPREHPRQIPTSNVPDRAMRAICRRTREWAHSRMAARPDPLVQR